MSNTTLRKICLLNEVDASIKLLKKGMSDLQNISAKNDFYHAPILMLSSGYERLIKCLLCLALMDDNMNFIEQPFETTERKGHNLDYLLDRLLLICGQKNYNSKFPAAEKDIEFLNRDKYLRKIISLLSDFAQGGRYYNLDMVLSGTSRYDDPIEGWGRIESTILQERKDLLQRMKNNDLDDVYKEINRELIIVLEKFARALARLFTLADFGSFAKQVSPLVYDYLTIMDKELGTKRY